MSYLLDTNVISELSKQEPHPEVPAWLKAHQRAEIYLSVITIGEVKQGITRLPSSRKRTRLTSWFNERLLGIYADWILPIDTNIMLEWGSTTGEIDFRRQDHAGVRCDDRGHSHRARFDAGHAQRRRFCRCIAAPYQPMGKVTIDHR